MISTIVEHHCYEWIGTLGTFTVILPFNPMTVLADTTRQSAQYAFVVRHTGLEEQNYV
jgi:hypothetical protein